MKKLFNISIFKDKSILFCIRFSLVLLLAYSFDTKINAQSLSVIGNVAGVPNELNRAELKSIFRGEKQRWRNGNKITIALMKTNTPIGSTTCSKVYGMSGDEVKKYWLALVFQGKAEGPQFFSTMKELENFVAQNPGSIGIVDNATISESNKIVIIDGKKTL